jgi:hypothetical protein
MPGYLLLRSNKESGPYALEQLIAMGLKPYDLVWIEGKSAAWRYPGEVEELKPYASVVEEQPYDRFYKKTVSNTQQLGCAITEEIVKTPATQQNIEPRNMFSEKSIEHKVKKYISVTMPKLPTAPIESSVASNSEEKLAVPISQFQKQSDNVSYKEKASLEESLVLEEKYSMPLDDIKQLYVENLLNKKSKKSSKFKVPGNVVILVAVLAFFTLAITAGFFLTNGESKIFSQNETERQPQVIQHTSFTQNDETTNESLPVKNEIDKPTNSVTAGAAEKKQGSVAKRPTVPQTLSSTKLNNAKNTDDQSMPEAESSYSDAELETANSIIHATNSTSSNNNNNDAQPNNLPPPIVNNPPPASVKTESNSVVNTVEKATANPNITDAERIWTKKRIKKLLVVDDINYKTALLGGLKQVTASITNHSKFKIDMIIVELDYLKGNDNTVKTEKLYFKNVLPDTKVTLPAPNSTHGTKIDYRITLISSVELDYYYATAY